MDDKIRFTTVWTDGQHHALVLACVESKTGHWKVVSNKASVGFKQQQLILTEVAKYGYDADDYIIVPFENCPEQNTETA